MAARGGDTQSVPGPASHSRDGSVGERSTVSTSSPYAFGSAGRDHALKARALHAALAPRGRVLSLPQLPR